MTIVKAIYTNRAFCDNIACGYPSITTDAVADVPRNVHQVALMTGAHANVVLSRSPRAIKPRLTATSPSGVEGEMPRKTEQHFLIENVQIQYTGKLHLRQLAVKPVKYGVRGSSDMNITCVKTLK